VLGRRHTFTEYEIYMRTHARMYRHTHLYATYTPVNIVGGHRLKVELIRTCAYTTTHTHTDTYTCTCLILTQFQLTRIGKYSQAITDIHTQMHTTHTTHTHTSSTVTEGGGGGGAAAGAGTGLLTAGGGGAAGPPPKPVHTAGVGMG